MRVTAEEFDWEKAFPGSTEAYEEIRNDPVVQVCSRFFAILELPREKRQGMDLFEACGMGRLTRKQIEQVMAALEEYERLRETVRRDSRPLSF